MYYNGYLSHRHTPILQLQNNLKSINTKVGSLGTVGLCYQLQKRKCYNGRSPELLLKTLCMEHYMLHVSYSSSPFSTFTVEAGPIPYAWLACSWSKRFGFSYRASLCCRKCWIDTVKTYVHNFSFLTTWSNITQINEFIIYVHACHHWTWALLCRPI